MVSATDPRDQAAASGYYAGRTGRPPSDCQEPPESLAETAWLDGYARGRAEHLEAEGRWVDPEDLRSAAVGWGLGLFLVGIAFLAIILPGARWPISIAGVGLAILGVALWERARRRRRR